MKYKILILASVVFFLLAVFFFFKMNYLSNELADNRTVGFLSADSLNYYRYKNKGDSLFLTGNYDTSFYYFKKADSFFAGSQLYERRKDIAEDIHSSREDINSLRKEIASLKSDFSEKRDLLNKEAISKDSLLRYANSRITFLSEHINKLEQNLEDQKLKSARSLRTIGKIDFETPEGTQVTYSGELLNDKASGYGYGLFETGGFYEGEWRNNKRHGEGKYTWKDGNIYEGEYRNDKRHGRGTYFFNTGEKYVGEWENNKRSGEGTMFGPDGELVISGDWVNDEIL